MRYFLILICLGISFSYSGMSYQLDSDNELDVINKISKLITSDPKNHQDYYTLAKVYYSIGDLDNSNIFILKAIEAKPENKEYRKYQENLEKLKNSIKSAQKTYEIADLDEAIKEYKKIFIDFPGSPIPYYDLGLIYLRSNNYNEAVYNFNKAIEINPYDKEKYSKSILSIAKRLAKSGDEQYKIGEYQEALNLYLESVQYYPAFSAALYRITTVYQRLSQYENAEEFAEKTLFHDTANYKAMKTLGDIYSKLGKMDKSIEFYHKSINVNPQYYKAYYSLSILLKDSGDIDGAISNLMQAIIINDKYDKAYTLLGVIYSEKSDFDKSIYNFNKALTTDNKNFQLYFRLAEVYNKSNQYEKAKNSAKESLKKKRNYGGALFELGYAELHLCNKIAAQDAFQKAKKDKNYRKMANYHLDNLDYLLNEKCQ